MSQTREAMLRVGLIVALVGAMAVPVATAVELEVFAWWSNDELFRQVYTAFEEKHPGVKIVEVGGGGYFPQLITMSASGLAPDVVITPLGFHMPAADSGVIADISDLLEADEEFQAIRDELFPGILEQFMTADGKLYGLPVDINLQMLFYNRDHFLEAGLPEPTDNWQFNDFVDNARKLTRVSPTGEVDRWGYSGFRGEPSAWLTWVRAGGGQVFDRVVNPTRLSLSDPTSVRVLNDIVGLVHSYRAAPLNNVSFGGQQASMALPWVEYLYDLEQAGQVNYAMVPQPSDVPYSAMGVRMVAVATGAKNPDLAYEFVKFMSTHPDAQRVLGMRKVSWVRSVATDPEFLSWPPNRNKEAIVQAMMHAEPIYPLTSLWNDMAPILRQYFNGMLDRAMPVETAVEELDRLINLMLEH